MKSLFLGTSKVSLPALIFVATLTVSFWVGFGRFLFGAGGWMMLFTLFIAAPIILLYGTVMTIVAAVLSRRQVLDRSGKFKIAMYVFFAALFVFGLTIVDGGDAEGSIGSVLTVMIGAKTNGVALLVSGIISVLAGGVALISAVVAPIVLAVEVRRHRLASDNLNQPA